MSTEESNEHTDEEDDAVVERQWPATITLKHPVEFGDERITKLTFRRGKLGDLQGLRPSEVPTIDQLALIASRMCGQPKKVIDRLDADDSEEVIEIAMTFFGKCLGAGKKRSR